MRVKLLLDESIYVEDAESSRKVMIMIPDDCKNVSDMLYIIFKRFDLKEQGKQQKDVAVFIDGYQVDPLSLISIIRESDEVL